MSNFPHLFSPLTIRNHTYRNRIITGPTMFAAAAFDSDIGENVLRMVEVRAKGGAAAVTTGEMCVNHEEGDALVNVPVDYSKHEGSYFDGFKDYASRIKKHGAIAMVEFAHDTSFAEVKPPYHPVGPVSYVRADGVEVKAMDEAMMKKIIADFVQATQFMMAAGFDGIMVHTGHGFLFQQFISPLFNKRTDEYGGSMENRARFPLMLLEAVREAGGEEMILELRFSAEDGLPGGMTIDDCVEFCQIIDGKVDIIHISNGLKWLGYRTHTFTSMYDVHGYNVPFAEKVKAIVTQSKVAVVGGINSPELAEEIIAGGKADLVVLARQAFADPEFPNKAANGQEDRIRRCVRCYHCYPGAYREHETDLEINELKKIMRKIMREQRQTGHCAINPQSDFTVYPERFPAPAGSRRVLIVGGGVAGMQAALTARERGHKVTLAEKSGMLGGVLNFTEKDIYKVDLKNFKNVLMREVENDEEIAIRLNTEVTPEFIEEFKPDVLILAVGATPVMPGIPGIEQGMDAVQMYSNLEGVGPKVVFVGGGLVGCEAGLDLAGAGHEVTVVEMMDRIAPETYTMYRAALLDAMDKNGVKQILGHRCTEILPHGVKAVDGQGKEIFLEADTICYAAGMKANRGIVENLKAAAGNIQVFEIGDCVCAGKVADATTAAYKAAMTII